MSRKSLFGAFATALAERLTRNSANIEADRQVLIGLIYAQAADTFGGERVYGPSANYVKHQQARGRIADALQAGESPAAIAQREGVTERHVRKLRGTMRP